MTGSHEVRGSIPLGSTIHQNEKTLFRATGPRERFAISPCIGGLSRDSGTRDLWTCRHTFLVVSGTFLPHFLCFLQYLWTESETLRLRKSCHINQVRASILFTYREGVPPGQTHLIVSESRIFRFCLIPSSFVSLFPGALRQ